MPQTLPSDRKPRIFIEASFTFGSGLHSGIQRVVRKIVEPILTGSVSFDDFDHDVVPVFFTENRLMGLDATHIRPSELSKEPPPTPKKEAAADVFARHLFKTASTSAAAFRKVAKFLVPLPSLHGYIDAPRWKPGLSNTIAAQLQALPAESLKRAFAPPQRSAPIPRPLQPTNRRILRGIDIVEGDVLVMLDSTWHTNFWSEIEALKSAGIKIVFVVYDLIPLLHQDVVTTELRDMFIEWIQNSLRYADGYVAISRAVADEMKLYLSRFGRHPEGRDPSQLPVGWFHLGAELKAAKTSKDGLKLTAPVREAGLVADSFYLMVGTLEPRKRHLMVLDAFEKLWEAGFDKKLVMAGVWGWLSEQDRERIEQHPEFGKRLLHFSRANDDDLQFLYAKSRAVIQASLAEGFGLPIIEAAHYGKRVICTDLPVFREVAAAGTEFFARDSVDELADAVFRDSRLPEDAPRPVGVKLTTWNESRDQLLHEALRILNLSPGEKAPVTRIDSAKPALASLGGRTATAAEGERPVRKH